MNIVKPCTLICVNTAKNPSVIMDGFGLYYVRHLPAIGLKIKVNIPDTGAAELKGLKVIEEKPLEITKIKCTLPTPEKTSDGMADSYIIKNREQFSPASVNHFKGLIYKNKAFDKMPYHFRLFIMLHEMGHRLYKTEWKCDLYALVKFAERGYNASNGFYALSRVLHRSPENRDRIKRLFNNIPKQK